MARFLFTVWPFAGHLHPSIAIARALHTRGHEIAFYTGATVRSVVEGEGFQFFPLGLPAPILYAHSQDRGRPDN